MDKHKELFPIVDETGAVVGSATRELCHGGSMLLHPVVHLHVFSPEGKLFLQHRSSLKDIQPGKWDTSVGGHVDYGEQVEDALLREAREELGLTNISPVKLYTYIFSSDRERELVNTFYAVCKESDVRVDHDEVTEGRFFSEKEISDKLESGGMFTPNFEMEFRKLQAVHVFDVISGNQKG